jgi:hypothetical protein
MPYAVAQRWPFGAWVGVVLDHFSRTVVARGVFEKQPTAKQICALLDRAVRDAGTAPRHIVTDQGVQFRDEYRAWCKRRGARPRFGAVGQHGSIAIVERFIRSMKHEAFARIIVPMSLRLLAREIDAYLGWYNSVSYCSSSLCVRNVELQLAGNWSGASGDSASDVLETTARLGFFEDALLEDPWTDWQRVRRLDEPIVDGAAQGLLADACVGRGFAELHPTLLALPVE